MSPNYIKLTAGQTGKKKVMASPKKFAVTNQDGKLLRTVKKEVSGVKRTRKAKLGSVSPVSKSWRLLSFRERIQHQRPSLGEVWKASGGVSSKHLGGTV